MPSTAPVRRRRVFYLSGFDPRGASFYHALYQAEAAKQQRVDACDYLIGPARSEAPHVVTWSVEMRQPQGSTHTQYHYLAWDDTVHTHWSQSLPGVLKRILHFSAGHARSGALGAMWQVSRRFFWMLITPLLSLVLSLVLAGALSGLVAWGMVATGTSVWSVIAAAMVCAVAVLWGCWRYARSLRLHWLISGFAFMLRWGNHGDASLDRRLNELAEHVQQVLSTDESDEVLLVAHCAGTVAAICLLAHLERLAHPASLATPKVKLKLLTLAQVIPMVSMMKEASWFRDRLSIVAAADIPWLDFTSPADPLCCALADPLASCGLGKPSRAAAYRVRSARFDKMFDVSVYSQIRRDPFRIHFQYLMSTDRPVDNNFFKLTAGPHALDIHLNANQAVT